MEKSLDRTSLWTRMRFLLETLGARGDSNTFINECLDLLNDLLGAERGIILLRTKDGQWRPIAARQSHRTISTEMLGVVRKELLEEVARTGKLAHARVDGSTHAAAHLKRGAWYGGGSGPLSFGALYFMLPDTDRFLQPVHVEFLESVSVLVTVTLDHHARLAAMEENLRAVKAHETLEQGPDLDQIMAWESMEPLRQDIQASIVGESSVMILGESGTGKTRLATAIAQASGRTPIVRATLGASDDLNTITSELFGHERGAYSGAVSKRTGLVEYADGGTLILDEVLNLPPHAQQLLLDFTQFGTYRPLGYQGQEPLRSDVRIISATNGNILKSIADTRFRQDLYFRLAGVTLNLPPLRERRHEVPELAERQLRRLDPARGWRLSASARRLLLSDAWEWEGNIRQLQAIMRRARDRAVAAGATGGALEAKFIGLPQQPASRRLNAPKKTPSVLPMSENSSLDVSNDEEAGVEQRWTALQLDRSKLDDLEREIIDSAMRENRGIVAQAARQLQVSRTSLLSRMATLQMDKTLYKR